MTSPSNLDEFSYLAPSGYYLGLRMRLASPTWEVNTLPESWMDLYRRERFVLNDPALRWCYENNGVIRWSALDGSGPDGPLQLTALSAGHGMDYGCVAAYSDLKAQRSYGFFYRPDREYQTAELERLHQLLIKHHDHITPPIPPLTEAEIFVLKSVRDGARLKTIAIDLNVTEGAIKQRLKNARNKLQASTLAHTIAKAMELGLL